MGRNKTSSEPMMTLNLPKPVSDQLDAYRAIQKAAKLPVTAKSNLLRQLLESRAATKELERMTAQLRAGILAERRRQDEIAQAKLAKKLEQL